MLLAGLGLQKLRCHVADWACGRWTIQELEPALGEWEEIRVGVSRSPRESAIAWRMVVGAREPPAWPWTFRDIEPIHLESDVTHEEQCRVHGRKSRLWPICHPARHRLWA